MYEGGRRARAPAGAFCLRGALDQNLARILNNQTILFEEKMLIKTNLSDSNKTLNQFDLIETGFYEAQIFSLDPGHASTGTPFLNVEFEILGPTFQGRHVWANIYLTEKANWKLASLCNAIGIKIGEEVETKDFLRKQLRLYVKEVEVPNGNIRAEAVGFRKLKTTLLPQ
jgi:hypothetical protein